MKDTKGKSFVTIMIVVAVSGLLLRITIEKIIKINIEQNESNAQATLKLISAALENYGKDNHGAFPTSLSALTKTNPAYLDRDYLTMSPLKGYNYNCTRLELSGYNCSASPTRCKITGKMIYTVTTGGSFISEECSRKE
jgi:Tfp pilus assembly protein PilE